MTVMGLNRAFNPSGNSDLPKYPGFIVMNAPQVGSRLIDMTAKKMADIFFGKFSELISSTDESNNKDQIDQKLTNQDDIKSKNQNKILIYSAVVVGALILAYFIF